MNLNFQSSTSNLTILANKQPAANLKSSSNAKNIDIHSLETREDSNSDVSCKFASEQKKDVNLKRKYATRFQDELKLKSQALHSQHH
ncbi:hypothetical protein TKK_0007934 [Trichogramma kaykai]